MSAQRCEFHSYELLVSPWTTCNACTTCKVYVSWDSLPLNVTNQIFERIFIERNHHPYEHDYFKQKDSTLSPNLNVRPYGK